MDKSITLPFNFTPRNYQLELYQALDLGKRFAFCRWSRRAGKDICFWNHLIKKAVERVGNYYYVFPNYTQGKRALWEGKTKDQLKYLDFIPPGLEVRRNSNEMMLELINGSTIRIVGSENIDSLRGAGPCGIVISEFAFHQGGMEVLDILTPMLHENTGWLIINSTPHGKNFMYDFENTIKSDPNWFMSEVQSLWPDLPNYQPVYTTKELDDKFKQGLITQEVYFTQAIEQTNSRIDADRKMGKTEEFIEQEYGVSYSAGQKGAYYSDCIAKARTENRVGTFSPVTNRPVDIFLDLGMADDTAIWFRQIDGNRVIWIDYYEDSQKPLSFYAEFLKRKNYFYRYIVLPHDGKQHTIQTSMSTSQLLTRLLLEFNIRAEIIVADRPSSKNIPIALTRERFSRYHFNEPLVVDGLKKVSLYHKEYDKRNQCFRDHPAHDWCSHAADALALEALVSDKINNYTSKGPVQNFITDFDPLNYED